MKTALAVALVLLVIPSTAFAARAEVVDGQLRYTAGPGERNAVGLSIENGEVHVTDTGLQAVPDVGRGCRASDQPYGGNFGAFCSDVRSVVLELGDRNDSLFLAAGVTVPVDYSGGAGVDGIAYAPGQPVKVTLDGVPDDGRMAVDNVRPDVESVRGTEFDDLLRAGLTAGALRGGGGSDSLAGGPGNDSIAAAYIDTTGEELGKFSAEGTDRVTCGAGADYVLADRRDLVAKDCEVVARPRVHGNYTYEIRGSAGRDRIRPRELFEGPVRILGGGGADTISSPNADALYGGPGNDSLRGGRADSREVNRFVGGRGNDTIFARDHARDLISCGPGHHDRVYADRKDRVARDCEHVLRR